jgi:DNA-directed RNA polymerase specialized sigma24 family protein
MYKYILTAMHYFTISEYARMMGTSRQAVQGKIQRKKLKLKKKMFPHMMIALTDEELRNIKG